MTDATSPRTGLGRPLRRVDAFRKVCGQAPYAADQQITPKPYVAWIVESSLGKGRVVELDVAAAEREPGVVRILTPANTPAQRPFGEPEDAGRFAMSHALLRDDTIRYHGQPIALVVGETLEAARGAALLVRARYEATDGRLHEVTGDETDTEKPDELDGGQEPDVCTGGDFDTAFGDCEVQVDNVYRTAGLISAAMEPHATVASWQDGTLTVHTSIQIVASAVQALAHTLQLEPEQVRIHAPFVGGGFGSKLGIHADAVLASLAAIALDHPVRVVQTRRNLFANAPHRGSSWQRVRIGAERNGRLVAVGHESVMPMSRGYEFAEPCAAGARAAYRCDTLRTIHRVVKVDMPAIDSMRAPGEAIGTLALESAIDEVAERLGVDPLYLRLDNLAEREPASGKRFVAYDLGRCLEEGAERFGWSRRPAPREREGRLWVGWGMAACTRPNLLTDASARVRLDRDGRATVELDMTDIGTGTYTILTQVVSERLGIPAAQVEVRLGDSAFPKTSGSGGSFGSSAAGSAVWLACGKLADRLLERARSHSDSPLRNAPDRRPEFADGSLRIGGRSAVLADLVALDGSSLEAEAEHDPDSGPPQYSYGAHFVELTVDDSSGEIRLRRAVGAFSFGRVLNPVTARSQLLGGMIYGIGGALTEHLALDPRHGAFMNRDFAGYHLATQRDVPDLDVLMLGEPIPEAAELGSKGIGELGLCGIGGAIANAVHHATGVRLREFPLTPDRVLAALG